MNLTIGIDPGKTGAIAILDDNANIVDLIDMPDYTGAALGVAVAMHIEAHLPHPIVAAYVEKVASMPGQGVRSVWTFGTNFGALCGALGALHIPTELIPPRTWQQSQGVTIPAGLAGPTRKKEQKRMSRQIATTRWPAHADLFARVKDDGRADACHIARHGLEVAA